MVPDPGHEVVAVGAAHRRGDERSGQAGEAGGFAPVAQRYRRSYPGFDAVTSDESFDRRVE